MRSKKVAKRYRISKQTAMGASDEAAKQYDDCIDLSLGILISQLRNRLLRRPLLMQEPGTPNIRIFAAIRSCAKKSESSTRKNIRSRFQIKKFL